MEPSPPTSGAAMRQLDEPSIFDTLLKRADGKVCIDNLNGTLTVSMDWLQSFAALAAQRAADAMLSCGPLTHEMMAASRLFDESLLHPVYRGTQWSEAEIAGFVARAATGSPISPEFKAELDGQITRALDRLADPQPFSTLGPEHKAEQDAGNRRLAEQLHRLGKL